MFRTELEIWKIRKISYGIIEKMTTRRCHQIQIIIQSANAIQSGAMMQPAVDFDPPLGYMEHPLDAHNIHLHSAEIAGVMLLQSP